MKNGRRGGYISRVMTPLNTDHSRTRKCRRCAKLFHSPDVRSVTCCDRCQYEQFRTFDHYGCDEAIFT